MSETPITASQLFVWSGLCKSRSEALRLIKQGGAYLNNRKLTPPDELLMYDDLLHGRFVILRKGKRDVGAVEFTPGSPGCPDMCAHESHWDVA